MSVMQEIDAKPSNCLDYSSFRPASTLHACLMRHSSSDIRRPLSGTCHLQHLPWSRPSLVTKGSRTAAALHGRQELKSSCCIRQDLPLPSDASATFDTVRWPWLSPSTQLARVLVRDNPQRFPIAVQGGIR
jgi:hypothetical protein